MDKVKAFFVAVWDWLTDLGEDLYRGLRRADRYFKMRLAVFVGYAAAVALTVIFISANPSKATNPLGAEVRKESGPVLGDYVLVRNGSDAKWTKVRFVLNGQFQLLMDEVKPGQRVPLSFSKFVDPDRKEERVSYTGKRKKRQKLIERVPLRPGEGFKLTIFGIISEQGSHVHDFTLPAASH